MKSMIIVALALVAVAVAAPVEEIKIVKSEYEQQPDGSFVSGYETANGINAQTFGELKQVPDEENKPVNVLVLRGSYSYPDENGKLITITYTADENGYHPEGESIPQVPARR